MAAIASYARQRAMRLLSPQITLTDVPDTLKILALPICARRNGNNGVSERPVITMTYMLYPVPVPTPRSSLPKMAVKEVVSCWRSGLWVLGRIYRHSWDYLMLPRRNNKSASLLDRWRLRVHNWVDQQLIRRWYTSCEEDFLRLINTQAQFMHFNEQLSMPLKRIQVLYPPTMFSNNIDVRSTIAGYDIISASKPSFALINQLQHLGKPTVERFQTMLWRSRVVLAITIPFYLIWPATLANLDLMMASYTAADESHIFQDFEGLVSLPLAYNLVRWFANQRCVKSGRFIERVMETEHAIKPSIQNEIERLQLLVPQQIADEKDQEKAALVKDHIQQLERTLQTTGVSATPVAAKDELELITAELLSSEKDLMELSPKQLSRLAKAYGMELPHLYKDVRKALEKATTIRQV